MIRLYTTDYCGYCRRATALLDRKGLSYEEIDVTDDPEARRWLREVTKRRTVPQIFINGESIGGSDELHALERSGQLDRMLSRPAASSG